MIFGKLTIGAAAVAIPPDTKEAVRMLLARDGYVVKLAAWLDGLGGGTHDAEVVAAVYDVAGNRLGLSAPVTVPAGSPAAWYDFFLVGDPGSAGVPIVGGTSYDFALQAGGLDTVVRFFSGGAGTSRKNADAFADGPSDPFGGGVTAGTHDMTLYGDQFVPWVPPTSETEEWYARLPFADAQALFLASGAKPGAIVADATWHGTHFDPESGAFAVVRDDGPLADLVGQRLLISVGSGLGRRRRVGVFVHTMGPVFNADISLTRRAFAALSTLAVGDSIPVTVEVLA